MLSNVLAPFSLKIYLIDRFDDSVAISLVNVAVVYGSGSEELAPAVAAIDHQLAVVLKKMTDGSSKKSNK